MKKISKPNLELIVLKAQEIIVTSDGMGSGGNGGGRPAEAPLRANYDEEEEW